MQEGKCHDYKSYVTGFYFVILLWADTSALVSVLVLLCFIMYMYVLIYCLGNKWGG